MTKTAKGVPTATVLRAARKLIAAERTWCRLSYARTREGSVCAPTSDLASCFCAQGAILHVALVRHHLWLADIYPLFRALTRLSTRLFGKSLADINDYVGRLAAVEVLDAALAELGEEP